MDNNNQPHQHNQNQNAPQPMQQMPKASKLPWILLVVVVLIVLAAAAILFRDKLFHRTADSNVSGYQAVFLTNGQVYFGKLSSPRAEYVKLTDIYYLQVNQELQPTGTTTGQQQPAASQAQQNPQLSLVKLGNELHGPTDTMWINRSQVLFYEDLKADGKVAQAIASYKQGK